MIRRFHEGMELFNLRGGVVLGLFTLEILAIIPYYAVTHANVPTTIQNIYLGVVGAFAASVIAKSRYRGSDDAK